MSDFKKGESIGFEEGRAWERREINRLDGWKIFWIALVVNVLGSAILISVILLISMVKG